MWVPPSPSSRAPGRRPVREEVVSKGFPNVLQEVEVWLVLNPQVAEPEARAQLSFVCGDEPRYAHAGSGN